MIRGASVFGVGSQPPKGMATLLPGYSSEGVKYSLDCVTYRLEVFKRGQKHQEEIEARVATLVSDLLKSN